VTGAQRGAGARDTGARDGAALPAWALDAARLPLVFAQVREDAALDLELLRLLGTDLDVVMVASGGCTAAALAASGRVARLHLVDPNPAQIALARLKLALLAEAGPAARLELLGHAPGPAGRRRERLARALAALGLPDDALGPPAVVARDGPDHAGRYERLFLALQCRLAGAADDLERLLALDAPREQEALTSPAAPLGRLLDAALQEVMAPDVLVHLFGGDATRNPARPFARHFAARLRVVLATLPAAGNPYLWQMLAGRHAPGVTAPWLSLLPPPRLPAVRWTTATMAAALGEAEERVDLVQLSNVLDWSTPEEARRLLGLAHRALRPGGCVLIRQLNSTLDVPAAGKDFAWDADLARELHARDRSFFYNALHVGRRR
jgi:S-adenosylmethionine-diacylglycerol 3-amino-3-carboxypropyl transferase